MRIQEAQAWEKVTKRPNAVRSPEVLTAKAVPRRRPRKKKYNYIRD
jgi:hypothetical protein